MATAQSVIDFVTGWRSQNQIVDIAPLIEYFLSPLIQAADESVRER